MVAVVCYSQSLLLSLSDRILFCSYDSLCVFDKRLLSVCTFAFDLASYRCVFSTAFVNISMNFIESAVSLSLSPDNNSLVDSLDFNEGTKGTKPNGLSKCKCSYFFWLQVIDVHWLASLSLSAP